MDKTKSKKPSDVLTTDTIIKNNLERWFNSATKEEIVKGLAWYDEATKEADAIGIAVRSLQDALGVETGDQASCYFGMDRGYEAIDLFAQYIESELTLEEEGDQ
tara:strand:+ start:15702 stop:16013 length:312 start_codon:yes stop_codon:yes gene_type:complete